MDPEEQTEMVETPAPEMEAPTPETKADKPETGKTAEAQLADMQAALKKANGEAAKYRKQLEAFEQAEQAKKDAELSEMDKLAKQLAAATAKATTLEREKLQHQAAEKAGLPVAFAGRLQGETLEDMTADAEELVKSMPKSQPPTKSPPPTVPPTNPPTPAQGETDAEHRRRLGL